jgi:hypothetical protein
MQTPGAQRGAVGLLRVSGQTLDSKVALFDQPDGNGGPLPVISSTAYGPVPEETTRPHQGGFVGRAHGAQRAALDPLLQAAQGHGSPSHREED